MLFIFNDKDFRRRHVMFPLVHKAYATETG
jgi:hypothetical protein